MSGRDGDADAIALAQQLAGPGATLVLTAVVDRGAIDSRATRAQLERVMLDDLRSVAHGLIPTCASTTVRTTVVSGRSVAHGLLEIADPDADLVVVGSSRRGAVGRLVVSDDARAIVRLSHHPVAVAPVGYAEHRGEIALIGAGYDVDQVAQGALLVARQFARGAGAQVRAIDSATAAQWSLNCAGTDAAATESDRVRGEGALCRAHETLRDVDPRVRIEQTYDGLMSFGREVDVLVVGAQHRGRLGRWLFGSRSEARSHDLACPLLVVPARR